MLECHTDFVGGHIIMLKIGLDAVSICCKALLMCCIIMNLTFWDSDGGHINMLVGHMMMIWMVLKVI